jgi:phosphotransferase system enzyme I (PtsI)
VLDDQLSAVAQAAAAETADVWVTAPMVSTVAETEDFVDRCHVHRLTTAGVIVEVPSAALLAGPILARTAFARIGTNDLTQYVMAADRLLADLAVLFSSWAPAVLQLVAATCRAGALGSRPVGVRRGRPGHGACGPRGLGCVDDGSRATRRRHSARVGNLLRLPAARPGRA